MSGGLRHPFTNQLYTSLGDGTVRVEDGARWGRFQRDGQWIEGDLREADPQFCGWIAGDQAKRREFANG